MATRAFLIGVLLIFMAGCSITPSSRSPAQDSDSAPARRLDPNAIQDAVPRVEPKSRRGNPSSYTVFGKRYHVLSTSQGYVERGIASWYGTKFHGRDTSSGEPYDMYEMTAAHKSLPIPAYVQVTNLKNGRQTILRVNDRGPFHDNRIIDLSYAAATKLGILGHGTGLVEVRAIDPRQPNLPRQASQSRPVQTATTAPSTSNSAPKNLDIYIQIGAFSGRQNADQLSHRMAEQLNKTTRIQQATVSGRPYFRVQIGPIDSVEQADQLTQKLTQLGIEKTQVVID